MMAWIFRSAKWSAIVGGLVLCAITLMSVASITGRALIGVGLGPVPGDFEMVEVGTALAVFFFLPWCYLKGGHATVDLFYMHLPKSMKWLVGMMDYHENGEVTFILQMPVWWAYALCMVGAVIGCLSYIAKTLIQFGLAKYPPGWTVESTGGH